jgi:hypothetical protein
MGRSLFDAYERSLDAPTHFVDLLDIIGRKLIVPEISDNGFILTFSNLDPDYSEFKRVCIF